MAQTQRITGKLTKLLIVTGTLIPLLGIGAAAASLLPNGVGEDWQRWVLDNYPNPLEQVLGQLQKSNPVVEKIMRVALGDQWRNLQTTTNSDSPDPYKVRTAEDSPGAGVLTTSPVVRQRDLANLYDQESARSVAAPVLGEQGKTWLREGVERTTGLVQSSQQGAQQVQQLSQAAQGMNVTQDVMKKNAEINAAIATLLTQQTQLNADNHTALLQLQRLQGINAQLSANTSEGIDEVNRRARVERQVAISGSTQAPIFIPGLLGTGKDTQTRNR
jgi:hypothetical protein